MNVLVLEAGYYNGPDHKSLGYCETGEIITVSDLTAPFLVQEGLVSTDISEAAATQAREAREAAVTLRRQMLQEDLEALNDELARLEEVQNASAVPEDTSFTPLLDSSSDIPKEPEVVESPVTVEVRKSRAKKASSAK